MEDILNIDFSKNKVIIVKVYSLLLIKMHLLWIKILYLRLLILKKCQI